MSGPPSRTRRAARVFLLNNARRVLLLRFAMGDPDLPASFWATPGGGIESGETAVHAARRELREELGAAFELHGPVHMDQVAWIETGVRVFSEDTFFQARYRGETLVLNGASELERTVLREMRWWSAEELEQTRETFFPSDLPRVRRSLRS